MNGFQKISLTLLPSLMLMPLVTSCSSGGGDGGQAPAPPAGSFDLTGTWNMSDTVDATQCGEGIFTDNYSVQVQQNGNALTVTSTDGVFQGSLNGNQVSWTGQYYDSDDEGTVTITAMNVTIASDGNSLSGTSAWNYSGDDGSFCSGTTQVSGTRVGGTGANAGLSNVAGSWEVRELIDQTACGGGVVEESYGVAIEQQGSAITVHTPDGPFDGTFEDDVARYAGSYYDSWDEGWVTITSLALELTEGGTRLEGAAYWNFQGDDGSFCSGSTAVSADRMGPVQALVATPQEGLPTRVTVREGEDRFVTRVAGAIDSWVQLELAAGQVARAVRFADAGPDEVFFTADDGIADYQEVRHSGSGPIRIEALNGPGPDGHWFSADDRVSSITEIQRGLGGELERSTCFAGPGPDGHWRTADDVASQEVDCRAGERSEAPHAAPR